MIEHPVQDHPHPPPVHLFNQTDEQTVAGFQIADITHTLLVFRRTDIILRAIRQNLAAIRRDHTVMRIDIIIILNIVLMVGRRYEKRIKINHINPQILQIIKLIHYPLQITAIEIPDIKGRRHLFQFLIFLVGAPI